MAPVTLPPSFYNSFWSPDYRTGLDVLFSNLEQGLLENDDVIAFIESQARAHNHIAASLLDPPLPSTNSGSLSSLSHTLLSLRGASSARGEAHRALAQELEERLLLGWKSWVDRHGVRIREAKGEILGKNGVVAVWEKDVQKLEQMKKAYISKTRAADDSEDDAKFAPATFRSPPLDPYTSSPKLKHVSLGAGSPSGPTTPSSSLRRAGTVADRISEKLRAASIVSSSASDSPSKHKNSFSIDGKTLPAPPSPLKTEDLEGVPSMPSPGSPREERFIPPTDPHGRPMMHGADPSLPPSHPTAGQTQPILISGLSLSPSQLKEILHRLDAYLLTTPAPNSDSPVTPSTKSNAALASRHRSSILGTYEKTFSGEELVNWLVENVEGLGGDWERCKDAAGELYKIGYFPRTGVGRGFDAGEDTYFILRMNPEQTTHHLSGLHLQSPISPPSINTNNMGNLLKQYQSYLPASLANNSDEPPHVRLRREATKADEAYREAVWHSEEKRLELEERVERGLRLWERWERERLAAVKNVLKQYEVALGRLPGQLSKLQPSTTLSVEAFNPDADLKALIEGNRTGPFRPQPHIYESLENDVPDVNYGIDLRRWAGERGWKSLVNAPKREKGAVPEILSALLSAISTMYGTVSEEERRRAWIYEVPLPEIHMLRNAINNPLIPPSDISTIVQKFNVPVACGAVKLWFLELNPPVMGWEGWEDAKGVWPSIGAEEGGVDVRGGVGSVLGRLSGIQAFVLEKLVKHFKDLIESTKGQEPDEVYITKLALSVGRTILRPQHETDLTIGDRTPSLFFASLITHYTTLFPPLLTKLHNQRTERVMPVKKRTALVDQRLSRSSLGKELDTDHMLELQKERMSAVSPAPKVKDLPAQPHTPSPPPTSTSASAVPALPPLTLSSGASNSISALGLGTPVARQRTEDKEEKREGKEDVGAGSDEDEPFVPPGGFAPPAASPAAVTAHTPASTRPSSFHSAQSTRSVRSNHSDDEDKPFTPPSHVRERAAVPKEEHKAEETTPTAASVAAASQAGANLKRGTSSESSRLRGPRAARGPRPAPGSGAGTSTGAGHRTNASISTEGVIRSESPSMASPITEGGLRKGQSRPLSQSGSVAPGAGEGRPTSRYGHSSRGSVSAAIAKFEKQ